MLHFKRKTVIRGLRRDIKLYLVTVWLKPRQISLPLRTLHIKHEDMTTVLSRLQSNFTESFTSSEKFGKSSFHSHFADERNRFTGEK